MQATTPTPPGRDRDADLERPDWIACIWREDGKTHCGRPAIGFLLLSPSHARAALEKGTRVQPCPDCLEQADPELTRNLPDYLRKWAARKGAADHAAE